LEIHEWNTVRLCGLVVRVPGYRSRSPGFDSQCYQIFWEVVGLEQGPLSVVKITEELLERNSSGSVLGNREFGRGDPLRWPHDTLYPQQLALTSPTSGGRSVACGLKPRRRNECNTYCSANICVCKGKVFRVLNALYHEYVRGSVCIDQRILELWTSWRWVVSFAPWPLYARRRRPRYPLDWRLGGPHNWSPELEPQPPNSSGS
jgi:hypothetical protein